MKTDRQVIRIVRNVPLPNNIIVGLLKTANALLLGSLQALHLLLRRRKDLRLVPDIRDTLRTDSRLRPLIEVRQRLEPLDRALRQQSIPRERVYPQNERGSQRLCQSDLAAPAKERLCILKQWLDLLADLAQELLNKLFLFVFAVSKQDLIPVAADLVEPGVNEEVDARTGQRRVGVAGVGDEVRGVCVCEEAGDDARLGDYLVIELDRWYETALQIVNVKVHTP